MCIVCAPGLSSGPERFTASSWINHSEAITVNDPRAIITSSIWNQGAGGSSAFVSFSFETAASAATRYEFGDEFADSYQPLSDVQMANAREAMRMWADASGLTLIEVASGWGDIRFEGNFNFQATEGIPEDVLAFAAYPVIGGYSDIFIGAPQTSSLYVMLHEIGHALGLKHPFSDVYTLDPSEDHVGRTVMAYNNRGPDGELYSGDTLGSLDLEAIQYVYGAPGSDGTHVVSWNWDAATLTLTQAGNDASNVLRGIGGHNVINGHGGGDILHGAPGRDHLDGGDSRDTLHGYAGDDFLLGGEGDDVLNGGHGDDRLEGGTEEDTLNGGLGDDVLLGGAGNDRLTGGGGHDRLEGGPDYDHLTLTGGHGHADGGLGDDWIYVSMDASSRMTIEGGEGVDTLTLQHHDDAAFVFDPAVVTGRLSVSGVEIYVLSGGSLNDDFRGGASDDILSGGRGNDIIRGEAGRDHIYGGDGDDILEGGNGNDSLWGGGGTDTLIGGDGNDRLELGEGSGQQVLGGAGDDIIAVPVSTVTTVILDGGAGFDTVRISGYGYAYSGPLDLDLQTAFQSIEHFIIDFTPGDDRLLGTAQADYWNGGEGDDFLSGRAGHDQLVGNTGDDVIVGGQGNDFINGGDGYDMAVYAGVRAGYISASSSWVTGGVEGGTDTISGVESLAFLDGQLSFHRDGMAAQVMRLYDSAFNRIPDASGFEAQLDAMERGVSLNALAQLFVESVEFQNTYGALADRAFVEQLYRNVLDREGDSGGITNALNSLSTQGGSMTRGQLLVAFSESVEHMNLTQGTLDQGLWIADEQTLIIARLYDAAWNRLPDEGGLMTWRNALGAGMSLEDIADAFAGAAEFTNTYGTLTDRQFIEQLYRNVLNREADEGGIQNALNAIAGSSSRGDIMLAFSESAEHIAVTRDLWIGGVSLYGSSSAFAEAKDTDAPQTLPGADDFVPLDAVNDDALVLPGVDDVLIGSKEADVALVLPGIDDGSTFVTPGHPGFGHGFDTSLDDAFHGLRNEGWLH